MSRRLALLVLWGALGCREVPGGQASTLSPLDRVRAGAAGVEVAGIALARITSDGTLHATAVGCARFASDGRRCAQPLSPNTFVRVASISKLVTSLVAMRLVQAGQLELTTSAAARLTDATSAPRLTHPEFPGEPLTVARLLSHTSSLRDGEVYSLPAPATLTTLMAMPGRFAAGRRPGSDFSYANINYVVLGAVIEATTGERFDEVARREVLEPAAVVGGYGWATAGPEAAAHSATPVRRRGADEIWHPRGPWIAQVDEAPSGPDVPVASAPGEHPQLSSPHGGLRISAIELARLLRATLVGRDGAPPLLAEPARALWLAPPAPVSGVAASGAVRDYGLGHHRFQWRGRTVRAHLGDAYGLKGGVFFDPDSGEVWVYLITGYAAPPPPAPASAPPGLDAVEAAVVELLWSWE